MVDNSRMPSITKIQSLIENAWKSGFDLDGQSQLGGLLVGTSKWIGASDICAMFSCLRIRFFVGQIKSFLKNDLI